MNCLSGSDCAPRAHQNHFQSRLLSRPFFPPPLKSGQPRLAAPHLLPEGNGVTGGQTGKTTAKTLVASAFEPSTGSAGC